MKDILFKSKESKIVKTYKWNSYGWILEMMEVLSEEIVDDEAKIINAITSIFNDLGAAGFCLNMKTTHSRAEYAYCRPLASFNVE